MGKLTEKQQKLKDQLTQSGKAKKAVIGSRYYYDMINDAVSAGLVTNPEGRPYTAQDEITENDLEKLFFHFEDGTVYRLTFNAGTDRGTEVWLDDQHPVNWKEQLVEAAMEKLKFEENIVPNAIDVLSHLDRYYGEDKAYKSYEQFKDALLTRDYEEVPEEVATVWNAFKQLQDRELIYTQLENGQWVPNKSADALEQILEKKKTLIRQPFVSQAAYEQFGPAAVYDQFWTYTGTPATGDTASKISETPVKNPTQMVEFLTGKTVPKKPNSWGLFQFLKSAANAINKKFGGKGLKEYQKYKQEKTDYEETKYYALTSAGYTCEKPASVKTAEREMIVDSYISRHYSDLVDNFGGSINFVGQKNPLGNKEAKAHIREELLKSPKLDAFIKDPAAQSLLTTLGLAKHMHGSIIGPSREQEKAAFAAGDKIVGYEVVRNYLDQVSAQQVREQRQVDAEIRTKADTLCQKVGEMLSAETSPEQKSTFLGALKDNLSGNTVEAREIRHFIQDAVNCKSNAFVNKLCDDFNPDRMGDLRHTLEGLVDPNKHGREIADQYVELMPPELRTKQTAIWARMEGNAPKADIELSENASQKNKSVSEINPVNNI